jgi:threonine dehydrogenase-like Zn-dependent dehydrogenase
VRLEGGLQVDVVLEKESHSVGSLAKYPPYGVGRVIGPRTKDDVFSDNSLVLVRISNSYTSEIAVRKKDCIIVPNTLGVDLALLAPPLAFALWTWEKLHLELGEVAVYTDGNPFSSLIGQVAIWRGGLPVIRVGRDDGGELNNKIEILNIEDPDVTVEKLKKRIEGKAGFAAIDLSGNPEIIDILLEVLPRWGRLMVAGQKSQPFLIDFYKNIHRKGASVFSTIFDPSLIFEDDHELLEQLNKAFLILQNECMAQTLLNNINEWAL